MKYSKVLAGVVATFFLSVSAYAEGGAALFQKSGCTACHQAAVDTAGPSMKVVSAAYKGNAAGLAAFLKSGGTPKAEKGRFAGQYATIMKPQVTNTTSKWTDAQRASVAKYILSH